ncbi:MAG: D-aminoacyl-tRNA deacylase [Bacilli bacterium]
MKFVIQIVKSSVLSIQSKRITQISKGMVAFVGYHHSDSPAVVHRLVNKLLQLRIFPDSNGKTNLTVHDIQGDILCVPNFTLYADVKSSRRPSFINAAKPEVANQLFLLTKELMIASYPRVQFGEFGADMSVEVHNDGPFTLILDSDEQ